MAKRRPSSSATDALRRRIEVRARKERAAEVAKRFAAERERIRRQRTYLTALKGTISAALIKAMRDRAWELLDRGETEAADALLEFVPEDQADALLNEFFGPDA